MLIWECTKKQRVSDEMYSLKNLPTTKCEHSLLPTSFIEGVSAVSLQNYQGDSVGRGEQKSLLEFF